MIDPDENSKLINSYFQDKITDGIIKGIDNAIVGPITEIEENSHMVDDTEVIDGKTYKTNYLELD